jgi:hypothetical protein
VLGCFCEGGGEVVDKSEESFRKVCMPYNLYVRSAFSRVTRLVSEEAELGDHLVLLPRRRVVSGEGLTTSGSPQDSDLLFRLRQIDYLDSEFSVILVSVNGLRYSLARAERSCGIVLAFTPRYFVNSYTPPFPLSDEGAFFSPLWSGATLQVLSESVELPVEVLVAQSSRVVEDAVSYLADNYYLLFGQVATAEQLSAWQVELTVWFNTGLPRCRGYICEMLCRCLNFWHFGQVLGVAGDLLDVPQSVLDRWVEGYFPP